MSSEETRFEQVLDALAAKEKRAQKRATLLTVLTLGVGLVLMAGLFYQIVRLRNTRAGLEHEVRDLEVRKTALSDDLDKTRTKVEEKEKDLEAASKKFGEIEEKIKAGRTGEALQLASTGIKRESSSQSTQAPGFVNSRNFKGPKGTQITIDIIPDRALLASPTRPKTLFTYQVAGDRTQEMKGQGSIKLTVDQSKTVLLIFDFAGEGEAGYTIRQTATAGTTKRTEFRVGPQSGRVGREIQLSFAVDR